MNKVQIDPGPFVMPMPTVLVGAEVNGSANFMPAAFMGIVNYNPVIVACGLNPTHHTCSGMEEHGTFSLNLPGSDLVVQTDWCGINSGEKVSKAEVFDVFHGKFGNAPMIRQCRFTAECKIIQKVVFEVDTVYFGEVVSVFVDDNALRDGVPDWKKIDPLIFTFPDNGYWRLGELVAKAWEIGTDYQPK